MKPKIYIRNFNGIMDGLIKSDEFEKVNDPRDADCIVLWQDVRGEFAELAKINKEHLHIPLVVVQHGAGGSRDYGQPVNFPFLSDKFCCWGPADYERLTKMGFKTNAVITGCTLINQMKPLVRHEGKNIIFCPVVAEHEEPANLTTFFELKRTELSYSQNKIIRHKKELQKAWKPAVLNPENTLGENTIPYLDMNGDFRVVVKLTPMHDKSLYLGSVCETNVHSPSHIEECVRLLSHADVVVSMVESTFQLLAMAMGLPVVICNEYKFEKYGGKDYTNGWDHIKTDAVTYCDLKDLRSTVEQELVNPGRLKEERKAVVAREFGDITSNPNAKITEVIKGLVRGKT